MRDDLALLTRVLQGRALCRGCLMLATGLLGWQIDATLKRQDRVRSSGYVLVCDGCKEIAVAYVLDAA